MNRSLALSLSALVAMAAGLGLWMGWQRATLDEGRVIEAVAARYVSDTGGQRTDCMARPAGGRAWLRIICEGAGGSRSYLVDRAGRLVRSAGPEA